MSAIRASSPRFRNWGAQAVKRKEPSGLFEIDGAKCKIGQYDFKLDKDFNVTLMSRD